MTKYPNVSHKTTEKELSKVFCKIGTILTSSLQPKDVINHVMNLIGKYFSPQNWSLLLLDESTHQLKFEIVMGSDAEILKGLSIDRNEGIVGWVCNNAKPVIVKDTSTDNRFSSRLDHLISFKTDSIICVPLLNGENKVIGAIELINKVISPTTRPENTQTTNINLPTELHFTQNDMRILSSIGIFTGVAIENAFLHKKIEELVMVDSLTGINNRHFFNEIFQQETEKVKRYRHTMCLLMIDVDNLKIINDTFGHVTGDRILCALADILRITIRNSDFLARYGGDEFVIIMPEAKKDNAFELTKRINTMIDKWNKQENTHGLSLHISIGIHETGPENIDKILINADKDLYQNKIFKKKSKEITSLKEMQRYLYQNLNS